MFKRLIILAGLASLFVPAAAAGASAPHKPLAALSVARGRLAITRYEKREGGIVRTCQAIDSLQVICRVVENEPKIGEEIEWLAVAALHPRSHRISVSWLLRIEGSPRPYSERAV
jgi:hypothetical protein